VQRKEKEEKFSIERATERQNEKVINLVRPTRQEGAAHKKRRLKKIEKSHIDKGG